MTDAPQTSTLFSSLIKVPLFSPGECDKIIAIGEASHLERGKVWDGKVHSEEERVRKLSMAHLDRNEMTDWIYARMDEVFIKAAAHYGVSVTGTVERLKFMRYGKGEHFNTWHTDCGDLVHLVSRKISMSVELSDRATFEGGHLEIFPESVAVTKVERGHAVVFPSFRYHRLTPVTRGLRCSLVNWISGPRYC